MGLLRSVLFRSGKVRGAHHFPPFKNFFKIHFMDSPSNQSYNKYKRGYRAQGNYNEQRLEVLTHSLMIILKVVAT
jgi:hypothetical protein